MPHARTRLITPLLLKRLRYFPVVAIQGARQTGKSFLARELLKKELPSSTYVTFDQQTWKSKAEDHPHSFLASYSESAPLIIDEAQKVPEIFDTIKYEVDQLHKPGRFLLLGSTEFSKLSRIRESLTGRMGRVRLFPFTLSEGIGVDLKGKLKKPLTRARTMEYLETGGMPALFSVRDCEIRSALLQDWIDLTCSRDIFQFSGLKLSGELAYSILRQACLLEEPTVPQIARSLRADPRRVQTHVRALEELFVLQRLEPHPSGTGKPIYLALDTAVAGHLGASFLRRLHIFLMNERMAKNTYSGEKRKSFTYYRSTGKKMIHLVEVSADGETTAFQVSDLERIKKTDAELMRTFLAKNKGTSGSVFAPVPESLRVQSVVFRPWETLGEP